jgi:hypothetical protein
VRTDAALTAVDKRSWMRCSMSRASFSGIYARRRTRYAGHEVIRLAKLYARLTLSRYDTSLSHLRGNAVCIRVSVLLSCFDYKKRRCGGSSGAHG